MSLRRNSALALTLAVAGVSLSRLVPVAQAVPAAPRVSLTRVADGLTTPLSYVALPDGRALIVDQPGFVRLLEAPGRLSEAPALDLRPRLSPINHGAFDERGVLGLALHPRFRKNGRVLVSYTAPRRPTAPADWDCTLRVSEFTVAASPGFIIDPASEKVRLEIDKPYANHNGGRIAFGPDGYLYVGVGDGGNANDEGKRPGIGNGQSLDTLLGKILRIDVDTPAGHGIPRDNPFADGKVARPEIWAYGIRNPWGLSFDRAGDRALYSADVGQTLWEEVNIIRKGGNHGWRLREGAVGFNPKSPDKPLPEAPGTGARGEAFVGPVAVYKNRNGFKKDPDAHGISVTGGFVYRGKALPELRGDYVYGDWGRIWGVPGGTLLVAHRPKSGDASWAVEPLALGTPTKVASYIVGFGEDNDGELYVLTNGNIGLTPGKGEVWKIVPAAP
ncbi:MAG: PQQ-dependent sugar dehydrogenase [Verrucomicrobia bacterium]|nr:PQQ-dependent sugar dehydrogenase [Verrucomicrobiota bacterium]